MAKRQKTPTKSSPKAPVKPKQTPATPEKPKPEEKSELSVNDRYDQMPDRIEDPMAVMRMALLDMTCVAANNKLAYVVKDQQERVTSAVRTQNNAIRECKAELEAAQQSLKELKDTIEATYGIALRSYTYNDETGVLTKQPLEE